MLIVTALSVVTVILVGAGVYWVLRFGGEVAEVPAPTNVSAPPGMAPRNTPKTAEGRGTPGTPQAALGPARVATVEPSPQPAAVSTVYVLEFGRFGNRGAAQAHARLVRSKGYAARVADGGPSYHVFGREFRSQASAERWRGIFAEIGLRSRVKAHATAQRTITVTKFAVDFGKFKHRVAAETLARFVRSRGYVAKVARAGLGFHVLGRSHPNKTRAETWVTVFHEIGLEASVTPVTESAEYPIN